MAKLFKLKISRVIPSFQSCRSKDPSTLPSNPVPLFFRLPSVNCNPISLCLPPPPPSSLSKPHYPSIKRHVSSAFSSIGCGFRSRSSSRYLSETDHTNPAPPTPEFLWEKEDKWHVVAKIYDESTPRRKVYTSSVSGESQNNDIFLRPPPPPSTEKKIRVRKKKTVPRLRVSTSFAESGLFSSLDDDDDEDINVEETEALVSSSRSFSTDSLSELNPHLETIRESPFKHRKKKKKKEKEEELKHGRRRYGKAGTRTKGRKSYELASTSPARLSRFQRLIPCRLEGKVRESFAVVKKSEDPHEDFRRSMMEMIMEKEMFEERDLEQLVQCFLSLNSRHHHGVIVQAFAEIWDALFCSSSSRTSFTYSHRVSTT